MGWDYDCVFRKGIKRLVNIKKIINLIIKDKMKYRFDIIFGLLRI